MLKKTKPKSMHFYDSKKRGRAASSKTARNNKLPPSRHRDRRQVNPAKFLTRRRRSAPGSRGRVMNKPHCSRFLVSSSCTRAFHALSDRSACHRPILHTYAAATWYSALVYRRTLIGRNCGEPECPSVPISPVGLIFIAQ